MRAERVVVEDDREARGVALIVHEHGLVDLLRLVADSDDACDAGLSLDCALQLLELGPLLS